MKQRSVIFSAQEVRAMLDGSKTQFRRPLKKQPDFEADGCCPAFLNEVSKHWDFWKIGQGRTMRVVCPFGQIGDRLIVKETWKAFEPQTQTFGGKEIFAGLPMLVYANPPIEGESIIEYKADRDQSKYSSGWRSSTQMPKWASRLTLEITSVRVERLQEISEEDAIAEGLTLMDRAPEWGGGTVYSFDGNDEWIWGAKSAYRELWESTHGNGSWDANPYVWAVTYKMVEP